MLVSRRCTTMDLPAHVSTVALIHPSFRVHLVDNHAVIAEDAIALRAFSRLGFVGRPSLSLLLEGRALVRYGGKSHWVEPGQHFVLPDRGSLAMRQEAQPRYRALVVEWDPGVVFGARPDACVVQTARDEVLRAMRGVGEALERAERGAPTKATREAWCAAIDACTSQLGRGAQVPDTSDEANVALSGALDRALSDLAAQPMTVDLEKTLKLSARQIARNVEAFHARYGWNASTWRDVRNRRRLLLAAAFLTHPDATLERVRDAVGYRSTTVLCRAFALANFPSPADLRDAVHRLAE